MRSNARRKTEAAPRRINVMRSTIREYQSDSPSSANRSPAVPRPRLTDEKERTMIKNRRGKELDKRPSISGFFAQIRLTDSCRSIQAGVNLIRRVIKLRDGRYGGAPAKR
jgi:hypothetical protein